MAGDRQPLPDGGVPTTPSSSDHTERAGDESSTQRNDASVTLSVGDGIGGKNQWAPSATLSDDDEEDVDPDSCLPPRDGPTYVMVEKLREINAALEQEPPPDRSRQRIIAFSEHVTELLLPPDPSDADSQLDSERSEQRPPPSVLQSASATIGGPDLAVDGGSSSDSGISASAESHAETEKDGASAPTSPIVAAVAGGSGGGAANGEPALSAIDDGDEKVLVEMEGKFELISIRELQSMGYSVPYGTGDLEDDGGGGSGDNSPPGSDRSGSSSVGGGGSSNGSVQSAQSDGALTSSGGANPRPPPLPRPKTATVRTLAGRASGDDRLRSQPQRPHTTGGGAAVAGGGAALPQWIDSGYRSPYGLTPEQRERKEQRERLLHETQLAIERRQKEEERRKREENEEAFRCWLRKKQEEAAAARLQLQRDCEVKDGNSVAAKSVEREEAFREWMRHKRVQQDEERLLRRRKEQEEAEGYLLRTRDECERAYKEWLHKKEREIRRRQREEQAKIKARRSVRTMSRKAIKLTKAIRDAQSFRYVDYYGYRF